MFKDYLERLTDEVLLDEIEEKVIEALLLMSEDDAYINACDIERILEFRGRRLAEKLVPYIEYFENNNAEWREDLKAEEAEDYGYGRA